MNLCFYHLFFCMFYLCFQNISRDNSRPRYQRIVMVFFSISHFIHNELIAYYFLLFYFNLEQDFKSICIFVARFWGGFIIGERYHHKISYQKQLPQEYIYYFQCCTLCGATISYFLSHLIVFAYMKKLAVICLLLHFVV